MMQPAAAPASSMDLITLLGIDSGNGPLPGVPAAVPEPPRPPAGTSPISLAYATSMAPPDPRGLSAAAAVAMRSSTKSSAKTTSSSDSGDCDSRDDLKPMLVLAPHCGRRQKKSKLPEGVPVKKMVTEWLLY
eukprot:TRINITY_DN63634_c0_g1_i1.p1 TRINITY_DN63634_c0_g1~~TRINITY_DN63634_c0_g1_i1.p1  ORF type:complete len:132 (+),score=30.53 TRINITY_DN63634_c0_g1_i1:76-471(+)